ncbi:MAG: NAD(P)-dependent oxidoreductase [Phycisphaerales bacterium]
MVLITEPIDPACVAWLRERTDIVEASVGTSEFQTSLANAQAMVVRTYTIVGQELLVSAPKLKVIGRAGVGVDNIDLVACADRGIRVVHTPDANSTAVAEYVFASLLAATRAIPTVIHAPRDRAEWTDIRRDAIARRELGEMTLGLVGLGRVGRRVARIARAFGMRTLYTDLLDLPEPDREGAEPASIDRVLAECDVVSLHVDDRPCNRHLINDRALQRIKPDAILINTSRGFVVDAQSLAAFLRTNKAARAILDVHDPEPICPDSPLLGVPNAILTPHVGAATATAHSRMSWVVRDVWRVLTGEEPHHPAPTAHR